MSSKKNHPLDMRKISSTLNPGSQYLQKSKCILVQLQKPLWFKQTPPNPSRPQTFDIRISKLRKHIKKNQILL